MMSKKSVKQILEFGDYSLKVEKEINVLETIYGNKPFKDNEMCQIVYQFVKVQQCSFCSGMSHTSYSCSSFKILKNDSLNSRTALIQTMKQFEQNQKAAQSTELTSKAQILDGSFLEKNQVLKRKFKEQGVNFVWSDSEDSQEI